jgi:hypothetical protein
MRRIAAFAISGVVLGGSLAVPLIVTAQPASAATPPLTAARQLCVQAYGGFFSAPSTANYQCGDLPVSGVNLKPAQQQCTNAYDGVFSAATTASYICRLPPSG